MVAVAAGVLVEVLLVVVLGVPEGAGLVRRPHLGDDRRQVVAAQQAGVRRADMPAEGPVQTVIDPETGLPVPVIPVKEGVTAQPVVQPIGKPPGGASGQ